MKKALISVYDKTNIEIIAKFLVNNGIEILSTGGTASYLRKKNIPITKIEDYTQFPEMLNGRVKTLHPKIYGGILNKKDDPEDQKDLCLHNIENIDLVIVNLYPFLKEQTIENIDIGGVSLIRAAAKNFTYTTLLTNPDDYEMFIKNFEHDNLNYREELAIKGFLLTSNYDKHIAEWLHSKYLLR